MTWLFQKVWNHLICKDYFRLGPGLKQEAETLLQTRVMNDDSLYAKHIYLLASSMPRTCMPKLTSGSHSSVLIVIAKFEFANSNR